MKKETLSDELEKIFFGMEQSRDCFGYKEHKVLTTNVCYNFPIDTENLSGTMTRLKSFAMDCYQNGWLQAITCLRELINEKQKEFIKELEVEFKVAFCLNPNVQYCGECAICRNVDRIIKSKAGEKLI